ncbi:ATP-binding protein [Leptolyngbya sp. AN03gr2]
MKAVQSLTDKECYQHVLDLPDPSESPKTIADSIAPDSRIAQLMQIFELSEFDLQIIAIALAPELDRRYDRLYAYLQDDVRLNRPTVDLALNLLCANAVEKLDRRIHFASTAPLIQHQLLHLVADPNTTLLAHTLQLDSQVVRFLLGQPGLDSDIPNVQLSYPTTQLKTLPLTVEVQNRLRTLVDRPTRLYFQGRDRTLQHKTAEAIAALKQAPLIAVTWNETTNLQRLCREAYFQSAVLYLKDFPQSASPDWIQTLAQHSGLIILSGEDPWHWTGQAISLFTIVFPELDFAQRRACWQTELATAKITISEADLDALSDRFQCTAQQISNAIITAFQSSEPTAQELFAAARTQSSQALKTLAQKVELRYSWEDLVLPDAQSQLLQELCNQIHYRPIVEQWQRRSTRQGLIALFFGAPGTGKTMAAEVIAQDLQLDLYRIDLAQIVSKYIGETEKNLNQIFTAATHSNAILLFDEADALFGKRSEIKDAHDRYANLEISYLLQKLEAYQGLAILTTNFYSNIDPAFIRRIRFIVEFLPPKLCDRARLWETLLLNRIPCSSDIDIHTIAQCFEITGAEIQNIVTRAAFLAAASEHKITMEHLLQAAQREYQKMGKIWNLQYNSD